MADRPNTHSLRRASRATIVIRKAREEDATRIAARPDHDETSGRKTVLSGRLVSPAERPAAPESSASTSRSARLRTVSAPTVVIHKDEAGRRVSSRLSGRHAASVRVAGGDTIVRYKSGTVVVRRADRAGSLRRQALLLYAAGYVLLFGLYGYFLLTGSYSLSPGEYLRRAFAHRRSSSVADLELAALTAMRGNRSPAEVRLARKLSFYGPDRATVTVEAGERLTLAAAVQLAHAIILDQDLPPERRHFRTPLALYRDTYLGGVDWPHILALYNSLGFFLLVGLFLWRPLARHLATEGKKTALALAAARAAQDEEEGYRAKFTLLAADADARLRRLREDSARAAEEELAAARAGAERGAADLAGGSELALAGEARGRAAGLAAATARAACDRAHDILAGRLGGAEHDAAIENLISGIAGLPALPAAARTGGA